MPMTMQMIMIAMKHNFGSHCAMICAFAKMRTLLIEQVSLHFLCKEAQSAEETYATVKNCWIAWKMLMKCRQNGPKIRK